MSSPTARTLELLRKEGWTAQVVERWNPHSKTRLDLFGGIDVLACKARCGLARYSDGYSCGAACAMSGGCGQIGVQATSGANHSSRKAKLLKEAKMATWLAAGGRLEIWSWSKKGARGKRKTWTCRRESLGLADFVPAREGA